jgi:plastocyanin
MRRSIIVLLAGATFIGAMAIGGAAVAGSATVTPTKTITITASSCPGKKEFCFKSPALVITHGTKVTWKNATVAPHTVTRCTVAACHVKGGTGTDPNFKSPTINPGHTYSFTFHHAGTYVYYCQVHGYALMHGTVTVH